MRPDSPPIPAGAIQDEWSEQWRLLIECWLSLQGDGHKCNAVVVLPNLDVHSQPLEVAG